MSAKITGHLYGPSGGWDDYGSPCIWCKEPREKHERELPAPTAKDRLLPIMYWGHAFDRSQGAGQGLSLLVDVAVTLFTGRTPNIQPIDCVKHGVPRSRRELAGRLLASGKVIDRSYGVANCRICGFELGSADLGAFGHMWPEKADHYVLEHDVWVPGLDRLIERSGN